MTDPERLSKIAAHSLAGLLLHAGAREKPSPALLNRTSRAVAVASAAVSAAAAAKSASAASAASIGTSSVVGAKIGVGAVATWVAIGVLGGAIAVSSVQVLSPEGGRQVAPTATATAIRIAARPIQQAAQAPTNVPEPAASSAPKQPERTLPFEAQRTQSAVPARAEPIETEAPERSENSLLAAEVRFVEQGRTALQRGAFAETQALLTPYERLFPRQQLLTEVLFLRMESCSRLGQVERARGLAARLLTLGVVGRQAAQAREVLGP